MATLKVRVRAATEGPVLRVQLPQPCTLEALKDAIASQIGQPASSFDVSLNKRDILNGPTGVLVSAFGVISGDLLFYVPSTGDSVPIADVPVRCLASHSARLLCSGWIFSCPENVDSTEFSLKTFR